MSHRWCCNRGLACRQAVESNNILLDTQLLMKSLYCLSYDFGLMLDLKLVIEKELLLFLTTLVGLSDVVRSWMKYGCVKETLQS